MKILRLLIEDVKKGYLAHKKYQETGQSCRCVICVLRACGFMAVAIPLLVACLGFYFRFVCWYYESMWQIWHWTAG